MGSSLEPQVKVCGELTGNLGEWKFSPPQISALPALLTCTHLLKLRVAGNHPSDHHHGVGAVDQGLVDPPKEDLEKRRQVKAHGLCPSLSHSQPPSRPASDISPIPPAMIT